jgi:hypothetical protein
VGEHTVRIRSGYKYAVSHFSTVRTHIAVKDQLVEALRDCGYPVVEVYDRAEPLYGFLGDLRPQRAEVIIRRQHIGKLANDIGFRRAPDGNFEAIISEYDAHSHDSVWLDRLTQRYAYHVAKVELVKQGFSLISEQSEEGSLHLLLRRAG